MIYNNDIYWLWNLYYEDTTYVSLVMSFPKVMHLFSGLLPYNFLCVQAGEMLSDIKSMDDIFTPKRLLALITIALIMFTLSHFARKRKAKHTD